MKKVLKISVSVLLLALAFVLTQIPVEPVTADTETVSNDADFQMNGTTLVKYTGTAKTVSVPAYVKTIGDEAFAGHTEMETLQFKGNDVEDISFRAFAGCSGVKEIKLPDSVEELGNGVFADCTMLQKIEFGEKLHKLGIAPFANCTALESIVISPKNTSYVIDDKCLYDKDKTKLYVMIPKREKKTYSMPMTVTDIAEYAFWNCNTLEGISLSGNLKQIPDYAFANCKSLTGITIPYSVNHIGLKAFSDCVNLATANIPSSVAVIHDTAFDGCNKLKIIAEEGTAAYQFSKTLQDRNQAEYEDAYYVKNPDDEQKKEETVLEEKVPSNGNLLASTYVVGNQAVLFIDNTKPSVYGANQPADSVSGDFAGTYIQNGLVKGTDIPKFTVAFDSIIADLAFYQNREVSDYRFQEGITQIGEFAFARSNISRLDIPKGVTQIGYGAFYHCDFLRDVSIPSSVTSIEPEAFTKSMWLENWLKGTGSEDYLVVGDGILLAYRGNGGYIEIPETVKRIGPQVFADNHTILSVSFPDSLIEIGEAAFSNCANLTSVTGGEQIRVIRDRAFNGCILNSAHIGENVEYIGLRSFDFSVPNVSESSKVVVFDNKEFLPKPAYEVTAERLSNESARQNLLGDTLFAIVDKKIKVTDLEDSVLSLDGKGFKGIIAYISSHDKGTVTCLACTLTKEELENTYIPEYINIDGKTYRVEGLENITEYGKSNQYTEGSIEIENTSKVLTEVSDVNLEGNKGSFTLRVNDSEEAYEKINRGYAEVYQENLPKNMICVQMELVDNRTNVPISKTGNQMLSITVTLPESVSGGNIRILTVDRNGQLENVTYTRNDQKVTFSVNHLSAFAFLNQVQ